MAKGHSRWGKYKPSCNRIQGKNSRQDGSVTVFLSLILLLLLSVFLLSVESAHMAAVRSHAAMKSDAVMESLFSRYEKELFDQFRILALNSRVKTSEVLLTELSGYDDAESPLVGGISFLRSDTTKIKVSETVYLTDQSCKPFQDQVNDIVTADTVSWIRDEISRYLKGTDAVGSLTEISDRILENSSDILLLTEKLTTLYEQLIEIRTSKKDLQEEIILLLEKLKVYDASAEEGLWEDIRSEWQSIRDGWRSLDKLYGQIGNNLKSYVTNADKLNSVFEDIIQDMREADIEAEYKEGMVKQFEALSSLLSKNGDIYEGVIELISKVSSGEDALTDNELPDWAKKRAEEMTLSAVKKLLKTAQGTISGLKELELGKLDTDMVEKTDLSAKGLLAAVKRLISNGVFSLYVDNLSTLSKRKISMSEYPSSKCQSLYYQLKSLLTDFKYSDTTDAVTLNYYLYSYLDCYSDGGNYDLEYVLGKGKNDQENLKQTLDQLVLLRQAANCIYLFADTQKRAEAKAVATAMLALTGNALIIEAFTGVILAAWAYAEAVLDVRKLLAGERIPFLKNEESFTLTLKQAVNVEYWTKVAAGQNSGGTGNLFELKVGHDNRISSSVLISQGLAYKDYLFLLLFFHMPETNRYRGLDMIQWNVMQTDSGFRISQCIHSMTVKMTFCMQPIFVRSGKYAGGTIAGTYEFSHNETRSYASG